MLTDAEIIAQEQDDQVLRCLHSTKARRLSDARRGHHEYCKVDENAVLMHTVGTPEFRASIYALVDTLVERRSTTLRSQHTDGCTEILSFVAGDRYVRLVSSFIGIFAFVDIHSGLIYGTHGGKKPDYKQAGTIHTNRHGLECFGYDGRLKKTNGDTK